MLTTFNLDEYVYHSQVPESGFKVLRRIEYSQVSGLSLEISLRSYTRLGRLSPMGVEQLGEQGVQLLALGRVQAGEQLVLGRVRVLLNLFEVLFP
jgi:hypothetical protein